MKEISCRLCSKQEKEERDKAIVDYYINNRLIAYGDIHEDLPEDLPEDIIQERVESFCLKLYKQDIERIRRKYESINCKS